MHEGGDDVQQGYSSSSLQQQRMNLVNMNAISVLKM